jgi:hypothetical protein
MQPNTTSAYYFINIHIIAPASNLRPLASKSLEIKESTIINIPHLYFQNLIKLCNTNQIAELFKKKKTQLYLGLRECTWNNKVFHNTSQQNTITNNYKSI